MGFKKLQIETGQLKSDVVISDIPFSLFPEGEGFKNLTSGSYKFETSPQVLFFLGMVTDFPEGSDRWGMSDRLYAFQYRIFIGDRVGRIVIKYADNTQENIPVIFGVNVWPYEMFWGPGEADAKTTVKGGAIEAGPYREPFDSDKNAARLLDESLVLTAAGATKQTKYIFALNIGGKPIKEIGLIDEKNKMAGFLISAITSFEESENVGDSGFSQEKNSVVKQNEKLNVAEPFEKNTKFDKIRILGHTYFFTQSHILPMRALAHRLYQYKEDIGSDIAIEKPKDFHGPDVTFEGDPFATIMTNIYYANLQDMATEKIDKDGELHTSTFEAPTFGRYIGFGTFKEKDGAYYKQIWGRDAGRHLIELAKFGENQRTVTSVDKLFEYLYDPSLRFATPNWKRVINGSIVAVNQQMTSWSGRENDGHGLLMIFIATMVKQGKLTSGYINTNWRHFEAAVNWYIWQMDHPEQSDFNGVLYSDSEPAGGGGYDLYSNVIAFTAISLFAGLAKSAGQQEDYVKWKKYKDTLHDGISSHFIINDSKRGTLLTDTYAGFDSWGIGFKLFAPLMLVADHFTYDVYGQRRKLFDIAANTYHEITIDYKSKAYGRIMGYCQAFAFQTALLLDEYEDITDLAQSTAMLCYHKHDHNYIVPEGVIMHPSGKFWYRNGDLGNSVQQAEIVKCIRIMTGLDDFDSEKGLAIIPRLPDNWSKIEVLDYSIFTPKIKIDFTYKRVANGYNVKLKTSENIKIRTIRVGPFSACEEKKFNISNTGFSIDKVECINNRSFVHLTPDNSIDTSEGVEISCVDLV